MLAHSPFAGALVWIRSRKDVAMEALITLSIIIVLAFVVLWLFFFFVPVGLWITAIFSGVRVSIGTLIGMRLRKVPPAKIVRPLISATKAGLNLDVGQMEAHYLAGEVFFDVLLERIAANAQETVTLEVAIEGDQVVLVASRENADVVVEGNAILVGGRRLVLQPSQRTK
jgi:uncharacterized protein YqfA (UPF0365 family)